MGNIYSNYLLLLEELKELAEKEDADLNKFVFEHQNFWLENCDTLKKDLMKKDYSAYHLGIIPSKIPDDLENNWFLDPQVNLQRVGLFADTIIFDDIIGNIINKLEKLPSNKRYLIREQILKAIPRLLLLKDWIKYGIVKILPNERILNRIKDDGSFQLLDSISYIHSLGKLPDVIKSKLSEEQQTSLSSFAGHALIYKSNKAFLLKEQFGFTLSADDTFYDIVCETLNWDKRALKDISNIHVLKKLKSKYLINTTDLVFELRKRDNLSSIRTFFRNHIEKFFSDDIHDRSDQIKIDQFSLEFDDSIKQAYDELSILRRKFGSNAIVDLTTGCAGMLMTFSLDYGASMASWIPKIVGTLPLAFAAKNIHKSIKEFIAKSTEIKTKPNFIIGSHFENR